MFLGGFSCEKAHALIHNFAIFMPIILLSAMINIDFLWFYPMRLSSHQVDAVFHPTPKIIITSRNVNKVRLCMKPLTRILT